ncbi:hypothetical protein RCH22_000389 [Cryobacterium psychrotolerans]|nr:hypothetical protein [Cryobacterium psychrotolerans]
MKKPDQDPAWSGLVVLRGGSNAEVNAAGIVDI